AQETIVKIGNLAAETVNVIKIEFTRGYGRASLNRRSAADAAYTGNINIEIVLSLGVRITYLQGRRPGGIPRIFVGAKLHPIDVLISINPGFRIQSDSPASLDNMMKDIRTAFRSIFFDCVTNNLTFACASTGPIVIPSPAPIEIPGHL